MFLSIVTGILVASRQQPKVTLELRGVRLEVAAPILAKSFGMDLLQIGPTLANEVVLIRAKDADPEVLKANLAKVLNATWIQKKEGWWLTQTDEQKSAEQKIYQAGRYKFFSDLGTRTKKYWSNTKPLDDAECQRLLKETKAFAKGSSNSNDYTAYDRSRKLDEQSPLNRLAYRIAQRITPDVWMKLTEESPRTVFCVNPTAMQQPFPFRMDDLIGMAIDEQNRWSNKVAESAIGQSSTGSDFEISDYFGNLYGHVVPFKATDFNNLTMVLDLNAQELEFISYDKKGRTSLQVSINTYDSGESYAGGTVKEEIENVKKRMVKVTGDAAEFLDLVSPIIPSERSPKLSRQISPSLLEKLIHPETSDPLSIAAPDVFLRSVEAPYVVVVLSDNQLLSRYPEYKASQDKPNDGVVLSGEAGWFLVRQENPIALRKLMLNRKKLGKWMRYIVEINRPLNLDEQAAFAIDLPWEKELLDKVQTHLALIQKYDVGSTNNRSALRIYGSLDGDQKKRAKKGGIPLSSLSDAAKRELFRALYFENRSDSQTDIDQSLFETFTKAQQLQLDEMQSQVFDGVLEEKSFALPLGLANNMILEIEEESTDLLFCGQQAVNIEGDDYFGDGMAMSAATLGYSLFKMKSPEKYTIDPWRARRIDENDIHLSNQRSLTIKLRVNNVLYVQWGLSQTLITDPKTYTAKTLPPSIAEEVKKAYDEAITNSKEGGIIPRDRRVGRGNPPPP